MSVLGTASRMTPVTIQSADTASRSTSANVALNDAATTEAAKTPILTSSSAGVGPKAK